MSDEEQVLHLHEVCYHRVRALIAQGPPEEMTAHANTSIYYTVSVGLAQVIEEAVIREIGPEPQCVPLSPESLNVDGNCGFQGHRANCPAKDWERKASKRAMQILQRLVDLVSPPALARVQEG